MPGAIQSVSLAARPDRPEIFPMKRHSSPTISPPDLFGGGAETAVAVGGQPRLRPSPDPRQHGRLQTARRQTPLPGKKHLDGARWLSLARHEHDIERLFHHRIAVSRRPRSGGGRWWRISWREGAGKQAGP